ncbi:MAG: hypothetical protein RBU37_13290, partial [Myxococcota bacterium]|nr:hypothetical protein [Myxococcota bacterium]
MAKRREDSKAGSSKSQSSATKDDTAGGAVPRQTPSTGRAERAQSKAKEKPLPFASNLDYLECAMAWMEARARRLHLQHELEKLLSPPEQRGYWPSDENADQMRRRLPKLRKQERDLQRSYDRRLAHHRKQGFQLAIDALCNEFELDEFERGVLLVSAGFCLSRRLASVFGSIDEGHESTPETFFNFNELSLSERINARHYFSPRSRLLANDLMKMEFPHRYLDASDLFSVSLRITRRTFNFLLGDEALDDEFQEFSSIEKPRASFEQVVLDKGDKERILSVV